MLRAELDLALPHPDGGVWVAQAFVPHLARGLQDKPDWEGLTLRVLGRCGERALRWFARTRDPAGAP